MDTWATSSLTPQIATGWGDDDDLFARTFPMNLRPQGPEIIRTWLFDTIVRAHFEHGSLPWGDTTINGWILDPDRKKMSKSKGNVVTPMPLLEQHGADAVRYWAANGRPGTDTAMDEGQMKVGRRLAIKLLNASKFTLGVAAEGTVTGVVTEALDRSMLAALADLVDECTAAFESYDYARALERAERFFWSFCDDYLELVKQRAYGEADDPAAESARSALDLALSTQLRLFAPFLCYATEEVWSWWHEGSIHRTEWPDAAALRAVANDAAPLVYPVAADVLGAVRKAKSDAKRSMRADVTRVVVHDDSDRLAALLAAAADVCAAGRVATLETEVATTMSVQVDLPEIVEEPT